jgi:hypothetical protein
LLEVVDEVAWVFEADGESDEAVGDAEAGALLAGDVAVGGGRGIGDEGFDAAEAFGAGAEFEGVDEVEGLLGGGVELVLGGKQL